MVGDRVAPVPVSAVCMMYISARTLGRVTSRNRYFGCLARQEPHFLKPFDGVASIASMTQFDAAKVAWGALGDARRQCTR